MNRFVLGCVVLLAMAFGGGRANAAMNNDNGLAADQAVYERDHVQSVPPEQLKAQISDERARKNAELRRIMKAPPMDFEHYAHPPYQAQKLSWSERLYTPSDPMSRLIIKALIFIVIGTLLLSLLAFRVAHTPKRS